MPQYRVTIKKITEADIVIEADSSADARAMAQSQPAELFAESDSFDRDVFVVVKVKKASE